MLPHTYGAYDENAGLSIYSHLVFRFMTVIWQVISPVRLPVGVKIRCLASLLTPCDVVLLFKLLPLRLLARE